MNKLIKFGFLLLTVVVAGMFVSCGKDNDELILGKWNIDKVEYTESASNSDEVATEELHLFVSMEFLENGKGEFVLIGGSGKKQGSFVGCNGNDEEGAVTFGRKGFVPQPFTWSLIGDRRLIVFLDGDDEDDEGETLDFTVNELKKRKMHISTKYTDSEEDDGVRVVYTQEINMYLSK